MFVTSVPARPGVLVAWAALDAGIVQVEFVADDRKAFSGSDLQFLIRIGLAARALG